MEKSNLYPFVRFSSDTVRNALACFDELSPKEATRSGYVRKVQVGTETWKFDSDEEFFAKYRKPCTSAHFVKYIYVDKTLVATFSVLFNTWSSGNSQSTVTVHLGDAPKIEKVSDIFERDLEASRVPKPVQAAPAPVRPTIFIGHGHGTNGAT